MVLYLARDPAEGRTVALGAPLRWVIDAQDFADNVQVVLPSGGRKALDPPRPDGDRFLVQMSETRAIGFHQIELLQYLKPNDRQVSDLRPCDTGFVHLAFEVDYVDAVLEAIQVGGFAAINPPDSPEVGPRKGGKVRVSMRSLKYRSERNARRLTRSSRGRLVAATMRTLTVRSRTLPSRRIVLSSSTFRSFAWTGWLISLISSRNRVPP